MNILGHFNYHIYEIKLECNDEETEYKVTCITLNDDNNEVKIHPFDNLWSAKTVFENTVYNALRKTTLSDVTLYQQRS